ncbi:S9 family peptidase [Micromonospora sp. HM5-17]|jgi:acetyl esterase/lipase|uniref:alpha/beta hydrolase family protein n=1 Tax=Micromonospora sp. HM5-17 TaxID=2487710 RepID=UPI000F468556|nr:alpha/beta hydrolase [Micromonospora sp. HM5-17]ROT34320.1 alpha/beta hydrolase [Micromonospora sp. HM5-17]
MVDSPAAAAGDAGVPSDDPRSVLDRPAPPPDAQVRYGDHPDQVADLRTPAPGPPRPLVVVIHGGFWRAEYDRRHTGPLAADLAARGYPVAQLEYRRTGQPGGGWPGTLDDVAHGVTAVPALARAALPADRVAPGPPILLGHSAGGHLALWYATRAGADLRGVLALAPVADLTEAYRRDLDGGAVAALLGGGPDDVPERYAAADPARRPPPAVPVRIVHGRRDQQVPVELSVGYASLARRAGADLRLVELPDCEHFGLIDPLSAAWTAVIAGLHSLTE